MSKYFVGLDLGQAHDYTALAVAEEIEVPTGERGKYSGDLLTEKHYHLRHLQRFALGTPYPSVVAGVASLLGRAPLAGTSTLAVDATGVGPPVVDMLRRAHLPCRLYAITITAGTTVSYEAGGYNVPKRDLVSTVKVLLQAGRLKIASALPEADILIRELQSFQVKISANAHDAYGAWREGTHDDLVLAVALGCWVAGRVRRVRAL